MMASDSDLLINVNMSNVTKLSSMNYLTWCSEIKTLLREYNLMEYINGSTKPPPATITIDGVTAPNHALSSWQAQDCLIYSALIDATKNPHQALIIDTATSLEAWTILAIDKYLKTKADLIGRKKEELVMWLVKSYKGEQDTQALEQKHQKELRLRKETEHALALEQERIDKLKLQLQSLEEEHDNMRLQAQSFESKYIDELILREKSEIALEELKENLIASQVMTWQDKYEDEWSLRKETDTKQKRIEKLELQLQSLENEHVYMRLKAEEFESKYMDELFLRRKSEIALDKERNMLEEMMQLYDTCITEQDNLTSQVSTWQDKYKQELFLRKKTEVALSAKIRELEERDNALKIVEESTTKQPEERQPPKSFICPITQEVMKDPHIAADAFTYEAEAIRKWLRTGHQTSPMTNLKLSHRTLLPNQTLRSAIQELV